MDEKSTHTSEMAKNEESKGIEMGATVPFDIEDDQSSNKDTWLGSTQQHPFSAPENAQYWQSVYETAKYEGRHRFDPTCQWSASEEKKLVRKVCYHHGLSTVRLWSLTVIPSSIGASWSGSGSCSPHLT